MIQEQTEQETTPKEFVETEKTDDIVNKEDSVLEDETLKPVEESNNNLLEGADASADSTETKPSEQNNESAVPADPEKNTEAEETEVTSADSLEE